MPYYHTTRHNSPQDELHGLVVHSFCCCFLYVFVNATNKNENKSFCHWHCFRNAISFDANSAGWNVNWFDFHFGSLVGSSVTIIAWILKQTEKRGGSANAQPDPYEPVLTPSSAISFLLHNGKTFTSHTGFCYQFTMIVPLKNKFFARFARDVTFCPQWFCLDKIWKKLAKFHTSFTSNLQWFSCLK